jgi:hypothetical protein
MVVRRNSFAGIRNQLMALRCPLSFVETHILALQKAYEIRAQRKLERQQDFRMVREPVTNVRIPVKRKRKPKRMR